MSKRNTTIVVLAIMALSFVLYAASGSAIDQNVYTTYTTTTSSKISEVYPMGIEVFFLITSIFIVSVFICFVVLFRMSSD